MADGVTAAVLVAFVCVPAWPGIFNSDSQFMLLGARNGTISNLYAPLHGWVWSLLDRVGLPPGLVFLFSVAAFVVAVLALVRQFLPAAPARLATAAVVLFPPVYGLLGLVGRDVWFATAAMAISAGAWHVLRRPDGLTPGTALALLVFAAIAADARQNGAPFAALAVGLVAHELLLRRRPQASIPIRVAAVTVVLGAFFGAVVVAQQLVITSQLYPEQNLYLGDLVGVSLERNEPVLDRSLFPSQDLDLLRARIGALDLGAVVYADPPIVSYRNADGEINRVWARQWWNMVRTHQVDYLVWRAKLFLAQLGITHGVRYPYFEGSVEMHNGLAPSVANTFPGALDARNEVLEAFDGPPATGSFLVVPAWYLIITIGSIAFLGRIGGWRPALALLLVVLAMQGLLFFTAPGSEYRLEYFQVVLGATFGSIVVARQLQSVTVRSRRRPARTIPPATTSL